MLGQHGPQHRERLLADLLRLVRPSIRQTAVRDDLDGEHARARQRVNRVAPRRALLLLALVSRTVSVRGGLARVAGAREHLERRSDERLAAALEGRLAVELSLIHI